MLTDLESQMTLRSSTQRGQPANTGGKMGLRKLICHPRGRDQPEFGTLVYFFFLWYSPWSWVPTNTLRGATTLLLLYGRHPLDAISKQLTQFLLYMVRCAAKSSPRQCCDRCHSASAMLAAVEQMRHPSRLHTTCNSFSGHKGHGRRRWKRWKLHRCGCRGCCSS